MKRICCLLLIVWGLTACGGGSGGSESNSGSSMRSLQLDESVTGTIAQVGEVDWYEFNAVEHNRTMTVSCTSAYTQSPVDFMLTVYEKGQNGNMLPIFGQSAPEDVYAGADIHINVHLTNSKHYYFAVRDFKDDDASDMVKYNISVHYSDEVTDNGNFANATVLTPGSGPVCNTDGTIESEDDVDCYRFNISQDGAYRITAQYNVGSHDALQVNLGLELYDASGQKIYEFKQAAPANHTYAVLAHLQPGSYYLVVDDQGHNDFSTDYLYSVCIEPVAGGIDGNDTKDDAERRDPVNDVYTLDGSLDYIQDQDWYVLDVPAGDSNTIQTLVINLHTAFTQLPDELSALSDPGSYRIEVWDDADQLLHSYDHPVIATQSYHVQIQAGQGQPNYIVVKPQFSGQFATALPYQLSVERRAVNDLNESDSPIALTSGVPVQGKIARLGDQDDYTISVNTTSAPKVLDIRFDTPEGVASEVNYVLDVSWIDDLNVTHRKILRDINGTQNNDGTEDGTHFKTSFYLPVPNPGGATGVTLRVSDDQNNNGADVTYTLTASVLSIPTSVTPSPTEASKLGGATPDYFSEQDEKADVDPLKEVTVIEYDNHQQPIFQPNTTKLNVPIDNLDANNQWQSDWITGFVDYDGDRDIFKLQFTGIPQDQTDWYCDIQVRMFADASNVEYSWTLFRDREESNGIPNNNLLDRPFWNDPNDPSQGYNDDAEGVVAFWADDNLAEQSFDQTVPGSGEDFWLGHLWGASNFYLSIQDFNKALLEKVWNNTLERWDPVPNQDPDNDWGNTNSNPTVRPYYFQVTVTYHPGCSNPKDTSCSAAQ